MPTLKVDDCSLYYTDINPANPLYSPLVLVHGAGGSHLDWPAGLRRFSLARSLAVDLPGHGRSDKPGLTSTLEYAEVVCDFLTALGIERAVIAGHSMGGAIAQQIALNMPDRTAGIILVGTGSKLAVEPTLPQRIIEETDKAVDWLIEWSWGEDAPAEMKQLGHERMAGNDPKVLQGDYVACMAFDVRDRLEQIKAPTLVLGSTGDRMVKLKFSQTLSERIPDANLVVIEGGGHMFPLEKSDAVVEAVTAWFSEKKP